MVFFTGLAIGTSKEVVLLGVRNLKQAITALEENVYNASDIFEVRIVFVSKDGYEHMLYLTESQRGVSNWTKKEWSKNIKEELKDCYLVFKPRYIKTVKIGRFSSDGIKSRVIDIPT